LQPQFFENNGFNCLAAYVKGRYSERSNSTPYRSLQFSLRLVQMEAISAIILMVPREARTPGFHKCAGLENS
jgi:hypothetical protein